MKVELTTPYQRYQSFDDNDNTITISGLSSTEAKQFLVVITDKAMKIEAPTVKTVNCEDLAEAIKYLHKNYTGENYSHVSKVELIRMVRQLTDMSLKESKTFVEQTVGDYIPAY